jgi:hypothetical protein
MKYTHQYVYPSLEGVFQNADSPVMGGLQWLQGLNSGLVINDNLDIVIPEPEARDVPAVIYDGVVDVTEIPNTGLGAGDFYYRVHFKLTDTTFGYIFSDGGGFAGGVRVALSKDTTFYSAWVDDNVTLTPLQLFLPMVADDEVIATVSRVGTDFILRVQNLTQATDNSSTALDVTQDVRTSQPLSIGSIWNQDTSEYVNHAAITVYDIRAGTSASTLITRYPHEESEGAVIYNVVSNDKHGSVFATSGLAAMRAPRLDGKASYNLQYGFKEA